MTSIRLARPEDGEQLAAIYAPALRTPATFEFVAPDAAEMARRVTKTLPTTPWIVGERDGRVLGYAYAGPHRERAGYQWSANVSVYIRPDCHRQGLGRVLYTALFDILRQQGFYNAYAGIALPNPGSVGLHESMGFDKVGIYRQVGYKDGAWHDVGWWQLLLQPRAIPPQPTRDLDQFDTWHAALQ